ncbi:hypothetical protein [Salipaludibacillus sp. CF4.18]|uniref:hypothetical protein n=1 Tax=Salipaludibacillus sp. CF4.18 TaxID=3373081 RepID=UPI003EE673A6
MFEQLSNSIKETIDRVDGYKTGTLIVERDIERVSILIDDILIPLSDSDYIQIRNDKVYETITITQALETSDSVAGWPLFAGFYCRMKRGRYNTF